MKLKEVNRADMPEERGGVSRSERILREFAKSGMDCAEVELDDCDNAPNATCRLRWAAKRVAGVKVMQRNNRVFLLREVADHA